MTWVRVCGVGDVEPEDVIPFDHDGHAYAIFRSPDGAYFGTDGMCTHERTSLAGGIVMAEIIECPKHNGRFNYRTGQARGAPAIVNLKTYPIKSEGGSVFIGID